MKTLFRNALLVVAALLAIVFTWPLAARLGTAARVDTAAIAAGVPVSEAMGGGYERMTTEHHDTGGRA